MKNFLTLAFAITLTSSAAFSATGKARESLSIEKAREIVSVSSQNEKVERTKRYELLAREATEKIGLGEKEKNSIVRALQHGSAEYLVSIHNANKTGNSEAIKFLAEVSSGIKSKSEAEAASILAETTLSGKSKENLDKFKEALKTQVESGKTLTQAIEVAAEVIGKKGVITLEKIKELCGKA